jgi:tetratricopeptide (TPR) repeat protein
LARDSYLAALESNSQICDVWIGLHQACKALPDWHEDLVALDKVFELQPSEKDQLSADYGLALAHVGRYDEAVSWLKRSLRQIDLVAEPLPLPPTRYGEKTITPSIAPPIALKPVVPTGPVVQVEAGTGVPSSQVGQALKADKFSYKPSVTMEERSKLAESFEGAARSESVVTATYEGYEKGDIHYNHAPKAIYHITKILKGPPLNATLPIRYEFHDKTSNVPPPNWKFTPELMPEKGSEWLLFIEYAVPRMGMFDTYEGSYGRQPASEENLNKIYGLLEAHGDFLK